MKTSAARWGAIVAFSMAACGGGDGAGDSGIAPVSDSGAVTDSAIGGGADSNGGLDSSVGGGDGICGAAAGQLFNGTHAWNQRIDQASLDGESQAIIDYLQTNHNSGQKFRVDGPSGTINSIYGITVLHADDTVPQESFDSNLYPPSCDTAAVPLPPIGAIEGEQGYTCDNNGDCHLLVIDEPECRIYELYRADLGGANGIEGCLAVWDLTASYPAELRGDCCTSADAAGLPIAAHMFSADDIATGEIRHAIRFILPNALIRNRVYVRPATHSTSATSGPADAPPYGVRVRLKADFDMNRLSAPARIVAVALQRYGMILSDGGNLTFTATNDRFTANKWASVDFGPDDLTDLEWDDFEVVELGQRFVWDNSCDCTRTPITQ